MLCKKRDFLSFKRTEKKRPVSRRPKPKGAQGQEGGRARPKTKGGNLGRASEGG